LLAKRREMEGALQQYLASQAHASVATSSSGKANHDARVEDASSAFDRVLARQTGVTGLSAAQAGDAQKLKELQDLARRNRIEERLAQLKAKLPK
jgi:phage shock protein A